MLLIWFKSLFPSSFLLLLVNVWKATRRRVQPLYGKKELPGYVSEIKNIIRKFIVDMEPLSGGSEFDVYDHLQAITFNVITSKR